MADDVLADVEDVDIPNASSTGATAAESAAAAAERKKGRGKDEMDEDDRYAGKAGVFESLGGGDGTGPQKC